jgi:hypothetical protein
VEDVMAGKSVRHGLTVDRLRFVHERDKDSRPEDKTGGDPTRDSEYIDSFYRGEWWFIGIYIELELIVANTVQTIRTPGLWGIESNSGNRYFQEVERQEYEELIGILEKLGVSRRFVPSIASARRA